MASVLRELVSLEERRMPEKATVARARQDKRAGKAASTQAGEFVREEIHHIREGKHGARSAKQAIAIGLSKARRAGVKLPPPPASAKATTKRSAAAASLIRSPSRIASQSSPGATPSSISSFAIARKPRRVQNPSSSTISSARSAPVAVCR